MVTLKPGTKLRSTTCTTEVVVVKGAGDADVRCGGAPMLPAADAPAEAAGTPAAGFDGGTLLGKRYATDDVELLCTKAGAGALSVAEELVALKEAKPLPASD